MDQTPSKPVLIPTLPGGGTSTPDFGPELPTLAETSVWQGAAALSEEISVLSIRELSPEEVRTLPTSRRAELPRGAAPVRAVERLKARHHELARLMAVGWSDVQISERMGVSLPHLGTLRRSPAFQQLLYSFMSARNQAATTIADGIAMAAGLSLEKLTEKLSETEASELPSDWLRKTTMELLDRAGHSTIHRSQNLTVGLTAQDIAEIKELKGPRANGPTLDLRPTAPNSNPDETVEAGSPSAGQDHVGEAPSVEPFPVPADQGGEGPRQALREEGCEGDGPEDAKAGAGRPSLADLGLAVDRVPR